MARYFIYSIECDNQTVLEYQIARSPVNRVLSLSKKEDRSTGEYTLIIHTYFTDKLLAREYAIRVNVEKNEYLEKLHKYLR